MKHNRILSFLMLFLLLANLFLGLSFTVTAAAPTVTINDATGVEETNATLQGTLTNDGGNSCTVGFEYGLSTTYGTNVTVLSTYIYAAGGYPATRVYQYWRANLTKKAETADYGGSIFALAEDSTYVYAGGLTTQKVYQYWKSNMTKKAETASYGGPIFSLIQDSTYVYASGEITRTVRQYWKSNMTYKAETASYGQMIIALAEDNVYIYAVTHTDYDDNVSQFWKSNLTRKAQTADYGGSILALAEDSTYVYAGGSTTQKVYQYWKSNMTKKAETADYGGSIAALAEDSTYVYAGGPTTRKVYQYWKSNMTKKAETASYGGSIVALAQDATYIYAGGYTTAKIYQYWKSNMTKKAESTSCGAYILALSLLPDFSFDATGLTSGTLYHFRAWATNSDGTGYGLDDEFLTKPIEPVSFTATANTTNISLTWTKGTGANNTYIERNTVSSWARGAGTLVYNTTGTSCKNSGLAPGTLYYYRAWSYSKWNASQQWSDSYSSSYALTKPPEAPTNPTYVINDVTMKINLSWTIGIGANRTIVLVSQTGMPTGYTDGTVIYNGTGNYTIYNFSLGNPYYFKAWSYSTWITSLHRFSDNGTNFTIGGLYINCYDVNTHANLTFNVTISNPAGTQVYVNVSCINTLKINATLCPQGTDIQVIVSAIGYRQSVYVLDIYASIFYILNTYLIGNETSALYYLRVVESVETPHAPVDQAVEDALVTVKQYINATGVYETISSLFTDANGYVNLYLALNIGYYKIFINKSGYYEVIGADYIPAPPNAYGQTGEKIFRIEKMETNITIPEKEYLFRNIIWSVLPDGHLFNSAFTITFTIHSSDSKLEWYYLRVWQYNYSNSTWTSIYYSNQSNAGGGSISYTVPNVTGRYMAECVFKKVGYAPYHLGQEGSFAWVIQHLQAWMQTIPDWAYMFVLTLISAVVMGFFMMYLGTGLMTGYIGIGIYVLGFLLHPVTIVIDHPGALVSSVSGWAIVTILIIVYTMGVYLWSRL